MVALFHRRAEGSGAPQGHRDREGIDQPQQAHVNVANGLWDKPWRITVRCAHCSGRAATSDQQAVKIGGGIVSIAGIEALAACWCHHKGRGEAGEGGISSLSGRGHSTADGDVGAQAAQGHCTDINAASLCPIQLVEAAQIACLRSAEKREGESKSVQQAHLEFPAIASQEVT